MQRETKTAYLSADDGSQTRNIISNLNFKLAEKGTIPPDRDPPVINLGLAVAPPQAASKRIMAGTVNTGTPLSLSVNVIDQQLEDASISATFVAPGASETFIPAALTLSSTGQIIVPDGKILTRHFYTPSFNGTSIYFTPTEEGTYTFTI